ncbi:MAG: transcriptional repressor LexA [Anaerolineales bacterium]
MMARRRKQELSDRHKRILEVLNQYQSQLGYPPSIREICDKTGITSTSLVNYYLDQLQQMGFIERDNRISRGIRLVRLPESIPGSVVGAIRQTSQKIKQTAEELFTVPILGRIQAGEPVPIPDSDFARFDPEHAVSVASSLFPKREKPDGLYALEVRGDSMIDAMINDGDIVIMRPVKEVHNGDMVAIWLKDERETTLKYFYLENGRIRLQPANPNYQPRIINNPENVEVQGKVVMVIRQFKNA